MILYPAIDMRTGKVVRLKGGDPNQQTIYSHDPVQTAQTWIDQGAAWLHVVNLDGAFASPNDNTAIVGRIAALGVPIQFGGGLRQMADIEQAFALGVRRVVLGTAAVENPALVAQVITKWGADSVAVGLDVRDGMVATRGWQQATSITAIDLGKMMVEHGARHALYTDVNRDGALVGVNAEATATLAQETGLQVIASGGVRAISDVHTLLAKGNIAGAILGTALYEGLLNLPEALSLLRA
jgi:phosphoribosylformimino-5-aminoimidazole carboxamide ribotide isomerase